MESGSTDSMTVDRPSTITSDDNSVPEPSPARASVHTSDKASHDKGTSLRRGYQDVQERRQRTIRAELIEGWKALASSYCREDEEATKQLVKDTIGSKAFATAFGLA